jgi:hypothetical protein
MDKETIICILVAIFIIVCIWHYRLCHMDPAFDAREGLHCGCARQDAAMYAWGRDALPICDARFEGQMPYKHPSHACAYPIFNPFYPPFGSAGSFAPTTESAFIDVPISRMVGDHVPLE